MFVEKLLTYPVLWSIAVLSAVTAVTPVSAELPDFTRLVAENAPAVVNISTTKQRAVVETFDVPDLPEDHPLSDLFRRFFGDPEGGDDPDIFDTRSLGSGFVLSADGDIVTNYHVIKDADEVIVKLSDRRELKAEVLGTDPRSDIALLKIPARDLPVLKIGSDETLKAGEWVLAIGSPFGFEHSVTAGIVSAKGRSLEGENYVPFIQTDVAINPGNSGGPLFNLDGEVIGINSQIYSRTGGFMGLSFAIPIDVAMNVVKQLRDTGHVSRGWLGVYIQEVTRELAESFGMSKPYGALVAHVVPDGPADKAGIRVGDVVLIFDGRQVTDSASLPPMVGRTTVGKQVAVQVQRNGRPVRLKLKVGELPDEDAQVLSRRTPEPARGADVMGMEIATLTTAQREQLGLESGGVLVEKVSDGAALDAGIRPGDVILSVNGDSVDSANEFRETVGALPKGKFARMFVRRGDGSSFVAIRIPD